jgi:hypothetical protein
MLPSRVEVYKTLSKAETVLGGGVLGGEVKGRYMLAVRQKASRVD